MAERHSGHYALRPTVSTKLAATAGVSSDRGGGKDDGVQGIVGKFDG